MEKDKKLYYIFEELVGEYPEIIAFDDEQLSFFMTSKDFKLIQSVELTYESWELLVTTR